MPKKRGSDERDVALDVDDTRDVSDTVNRCAEGN